MLLQAGDIAFSVPDSLVVTLERVLGNETIGKVLSYSIHFRATSSSPFCLALNITTN